MGLERKKPADASMSAGGVDICGKTLFIDASRGIAGDMLLAALLDLGVPIEAVEGPLQRALPPHRLTVTKHFRRGIQCRQVTVVSEEESPPHRHLGDIEAILADADLPGEVTDRAHQAFTELARAEASVHGVEPDEVHFHEVGAVDSLADIIGVLLAVHWLDPTAVFCSPLPLGSGTVSAEHGRMPVPAPATLELLRGIPTRPYEVGREVTTPTGALLARIVGGSFGPPPAAPPIAQGWGAGTAVAPDHEAPNLLRVIAFENPTVDLPEEVITLLESNVDHLDGESAGALIVGMIDAGALDAFLIPTVQKKSRPGLLVTVLCNPIDAPRLRERLLRETGSLGVRQRDQARTALRRDWLTVELHGHPVRVKRGWLSDECIVARGEHDDLQRVSEATGVPLRVLRGDLERLIGGIAGE